jgi:hypothetical protein
LKPIYIGFDNYLMENTIHNSIYSNENKWLKNEDDLMFQMKIWEEIRKLPPLQMRIMYLVECIPILCISEKRRYEHERAG